MLTLALLLMIGLGAVVGRLRHTAPVPKPGESPTVQNYPGLDRHASVAQDLQVVSILAGVAILVQIAKIIGWLPAGW